MNFVPNRCELPLFLFSRNTLKKSRVDELKNYIEKKGQLYLEQCRKDDVKMTASHKKLRHLVGLDPSKLTQCSERPSGKRPASRDIDTEKSWQLPPNRYNTTSIPYESKKGAGGAFWFKKKFVKQVATKKKDVQQIVRPSEETNIESITKSSSKGIIESNARALKPSARIMISTLPLCLRNSTEPGPTKYNLKNHEIQFNAAPRKNTNLELPHKFYQHSCVPETQRKDNKSKNRITPGPGRYDIRYPQLCRCRPKLIYYPSLQLHIDHQKRLKFRRKLFHKIQKKKYCSPDWKHVPGNGHTWLFKSRKIEPIAAVPIKEKRNEKRNEQMYPDSRYITMINVPRRSELTFWDMPVLPPKIRFNSIIKRTSKKRLKINKKIGFLSGEDRFKDVDSRPPLTYEQIQAIKKSLPPKLRIKHEPVTNVPIADITPRVFDNRSLLEKQRQATVKRSFKFPPLPGLKMLLDDEDAHPKPENLPGYYYKKYKAEDYFKPVFK